MSSRGDTSWLDDPAPNRREPRGGRRRRRRGDDEDDDEDGEGSGSRDAGSKSDSRRDRDRGRREPTSSGWGNDEGKRGGGGKTMDDNDSAGSKRGEASSGWGANNSGDDGKRRAVVEKTGKKKGRNYFDDDGDDGDDIPTIPDLEEEEDMDADDITMQVAAAPRHVTRKVQSFRELDHDIMHSLPEADKHIDLSLLTSALCPKEMVEESSEVWEFDGLFENVSQQLHTFQEEKRVDEAEEKARNKKAAKANRRQEANVEGESEGGGRRGRRSRRPR